MTDRILFFPVGNGDMTLIELESGRTILIDVNIQARADDAARQEAWFLGLEYLELVLLKLFDYPYILRLEED